MTTTLTREALLEKCKPRYEEHDVLGFGRIGIRTQSELQRTRRMHSLFDENGSVVENARALRRVHMIVDQIMSDEDTPMFNESDVTTLAQLGSTKLDPLVAAINRFNEGDEKKDEDESSDTSES